MSIVKKTDKHPRSIDAFHSATGLAQPDHSTTPTEQELQTTVLRLEVASYNAQMSAELAGMARNSDLSLLSYFLDMAAAEAREAGQIPQKTVEPGIDFAEIHRDQPNS